MLWCADVVVCSCCGVLMLWCVCPVQVLLSLVGHDNVMINSVDCFAERYSEPMNLYVKASVPCLPMLCEPCLGSLVALAGLPHGPLMPPSCPPSCTWQGSRNLLSYTTAPPALGGLNRLSLAFWRLAIATTTLFLTSVLASAQVHAQPQMSCLATIVLAPWPRTHRGCMWEDPCQGLTDMAVQLWAYTVYVIPAAGKYASLTDPLWLFCWHCWHASSLCALSLPT